VRLLFLQPARPINLLQADIAFTTVRWVVVMFLMKLWQLFVFSFHLLGGVRIRVGVRVCDVNSMKQMVLQMVLRILRR
jgi:hypothetical protein